MIAQQRYGKRPLHRWFAADVAKGGVRPIPNRMMRWQRRPDHFDWFSSYLGARRMATTTRILLAFVTLSLACIPLGMLFSSAPPSGMVGTIQSVLAGVGGTAAALLWVARFPTKRQSIVYAATCSASIAMAALAQSDPLTALMSCTAFATISGYIALFHTALLMTTNLVVMVGVSAVPAMTFATANGVVWAACVYGLMLIVNIAVPCAIQIVVRALGVDVLRADRDPLTGLYTRRAFHEHTTRLIAGSDGDTHLAMAMIDLDKFKNLNDTHGHAEGDRALAAVGRALRDHTRRGAVVGRAGGEEFLVAELSTDARSDLLGQRLCKAIAALPYQITGSVGVARCRTDGLVKGRGGDAVITELIGAADAAMYAAKRSGGNQVRNHRAPRQAITSSLESRQWNDSAKRWQRAPLGAHPAEQHGYSPGAGAPADSMLGDTDVTAPLFAVHTHSADRPRHQSTSTVSSFAPRRSGAQHRRDRRGRIPAASPPG